MHTQGTTRLVGLLGFPVGHSLSPAMHNEGFRQLNIDAEYVLMPTPPEDLPAAVERLRDPKYLGANVTLPHKQAAYVLMDELSEMSRIMGVVNTIVNRSGKLHGDTTDPVGFLENFAEAGHSFDGKSVAILGNGGSARTIAFALALKTKARVISIVARSPDKSATLLAEIREAASSYEILSQRALLIAAPLAELTSLSFSGYVVARKDYDIVVNTTPMGMDPNVDQSPLEVNELEPHQIVYDIVYNPEETRLLREARARGCAVVGGLGMLVHQGLASFEQWTGRNPGSAAFHEGIRKHRLLKAGMNA